MSCRVRHDSGTALARARSASAWAPSSRPSCAIGVCALPADDPILGAWRVIYSTAHQNYIAMDMVQYVNDFCATLPNL